MLTILVPTFYGASTNLSKGGVDFTKEIRVPVYWAASVFLLSLVIYFLINDKMNFSANMLQIKKGFSLPVFVGLLTSFIISLIFLIKKGATSLKEYFRVLWIPGMLLFILVVFIFFGNILESLFSKELVEEMTGQFKAKG